MIKYSSFKKIEVKTCNLSSFTLTSLITLPKRLYSKIFILTVKTYAMRLSHCLGDDQSKAGDYLTMAHFERGRSEISLWMGKNAKDS